MMEGVDNTAPSAGIIGSDKSFSTFDGIIAPVFKSFPFVVISTFLVNIQSSSILNPITILQTIIIFTVRIADIYFIKNV